MHAYGISKLFQDITDDNLQLTDLHAYLESSINIHEKNNEGFTPFLFAISLGRNRITRLLFNAGVYFDINVRNEKSTNENALHYACCKNNLEICHWLINWGIDVMAVDCSGRTALHYTIFHTTNLEIVQLLIDCNVNINAIDNEGQTALLYACRQNKLQLVTFLLDCGADRYIRDTFNRSPLHVSCSGGFQGIVNKLLDIKDAHKLFEFVNLADSANKTALFNTTSISILKRLFLCHAAFDHRDGLGRNKLHHVTAKNNYEIIGLISSFSSAIICGRDDFGKQPIHYAKTTKAQWRLIDSGANLSVKDNDGRTALHYAIINCISNVAIEFLITNLTMATINHIDRYGKTALHIAMAMNDQKLVLYLMRIPEIIIDYESPNIQKYFADRTINFPSIICNKRQIFFLVRQNLKNLNSIAKNKYYSKFKEYFHEFEKMESHAAVNGLNMLENFMNPIGHSYHLRTISLREFPHFGRFYQAKMDHLKLRELLSSQCIKILQTFYILQNINQYRFVLNLLNIEELEHLINNYESE